MAPLDLTTVLRDAPVGEWIALSSTQDCIVATAKTLADAVKAAHQKGEEHAVVMKVPAVGSLIL
jgi:hypothetical protein